MKKILFILSLCLILLSISTAGSGFTIISGAGSHTTEENSATIDKTSSEPKKDIKSIELSEREKKIQELEEKVRPLPASDRKGNLHLYKKLSELDPGNPTYQRKVTYYSKPRTKTDPSRLEVNQLITKHNDSLKTLSNPIRFRIKSRDENVKSIIYQLRANDNLGAIITADKNNEIVQDFVFIGTGDGTLKSGMNIIISAVAAVMAFENPNMTKNKRSQITKKLGFLNGGLPEGKTNKFTRNSVDYSISKSKLLGVILTAHPRESG